MMLRKYCVFFIILTYQTFSQNPGWVKIEEIVNKSWYEYDFLKCADSLNCMIGAQTHGMGGFYIRRTTDGGESWKNVYSDSGYYADQNNHKFVPKLHAFSFPNKKLFIAVGDTGLILRSTDNGETWENKRLDIESNLHSVNMADEHYGILLGINYAFTLGTYYVTTNGGITWDNLSKNDDLGQINFIHRNLFYALSWMKNKDSTDVMKLIKVYNNWERVDTLELPHEAVELFFLDENNGWFTAANSTIDPNGWYKFSQLIYHTSDGGMTWDKQRDTNYKGEGLTGIHFYDKNFGMATGFSGLILVTKDGGKMWREEFVSDSVPEDWIYHLFDVQVISATTALVLSYGDGSCIFKYYRDPADGIEDAIRINSNYLNVFPNPTKEVIKISGDSHYTMNGRTEVRIFNILGIEIKKFNIIFPEAEKEFNIDVSELPPGLYFVRVGNRISKFLKI